MTEDYKHGINQVTELFNNIGQVNIYMCKQCNRNCDQVLKSMQLFPKTKHSTWIDITHISVI